MSRSRVKKVLSAPMRRIPRYRHQFRPNLSNRIYSKIDEKGVYSYRYNWYHLHQIHHCSNNWRIPQCYYRLHGGCSCPFSWHIRRNLSNKSNELKLKRKQSYVYKTFLSLSISSSFKNWHVVRRWRSVKKTFIITSTIDAISSKSILAVAVEGSLSVVTNWMEAAVVCFDGTLVDI